MPGSRLRLRYCQNQSQRIVKLPKQVQSGETWLAQLFTWARKNPIVKLSTGLISGRKALQRLMDEGPALLNAIQDVYLDPENYHCLDRAGIAANPVH